MRRARSLQWSCCRWACCHPSKESANRFAAVFRYVAPLPPADPIFPMMHEIQSIRVTPLGALSVDEMCSVCDRDCTRLAWRGRARRSLVPMPNASVPNAPCVEVGCRTDNGLAGAAYAQLWAIMCHDALILGCSGKRPDPEFAAVFLKRVELGAWHRYRDGQRASGV